MKKLYKNGSILILAITLLFITNQARSQSSTGENQINLGIPELNLLATTSSNLNLELTTSVAGEAIQSSAKDSAYVQVSSIIGTTGETRKITAAYDGIPAGTELSVSATEPQATGGNAGGNLGTGLSNITLSTTAQDIVTGIGSCYTGTGAEDGYKLVYQWSTAAGAYGDIVATSSDVAVVTLTLTDDM